MRVQPWSIGLVPSSKRFPARAQGSVAPSTTGGHRKEAVVWERPLLGTGCETSRVWRDEEQGFAV